MRVNIKQVLFHAAVVFLLTINLGVATGLCDEKDTLPIRIGAVLALTGDSAAPNSAFLEGIQLALEEVNRQPIWHGRKIELIVEDGQLLPKESFRAIKKLISLDRVVAIINSSAIESKAGASLFNNAKVPAMTLWDASPEIEALGDFIFSIGLWTPSSADVAADFIVSKLDKRRTYVFNTQDEWSLELERELRKRLPEIDAQVVGTTTFNPGEDDFRTSILKAQKSGADALYVTVAYNTAAFFRQLRQQSWNVPVVTSDIISESLLAATPGFYEGVYQTQIYTPLAPATEHMLKLYEQKYKHRCEWLPWVAWGYDGLHLLARSIAKIGPDSEKIAAQLAAVQDYAGASGNITMTATRSSPRKPSVFQIRKGRFVRVE